MNVAAIHYRHCPSCGLTTDKCECVPARTGQEIQSDLPVDPPGMVRPGLSGGYFVKSSTTEGRWYFVWGRSCSCPAGAHGRRCKHLRSVDAFVKALDERSKRPARPVNRSLMCD
jgi:hypothetical protein